MIFGQPKLDPVLYLEEAFKFKSKAVHINEDAYVALGYNYSQQTLLQKITRVPQGRPRMEEFMPVLPWPVERFGLASFKGLLLMVGGSFTSDAKPAGAGTYSKRVFTYSPQTKKLEVTFPPMRVGCASPAVVTHEGLIIVIHGEGADSGVEALDTTSPNSKWKEAEPLPYFSATPSATIAAGYLVVWIGTLYCMHLSCITSPKQTSQYLPSSWFALPSPPKAKSRDFTTYKGRLAAFTIANDDKVYLHVFDHASQQWIKLQELGSTHARDPMIRVSVTEKSVVAIWEDQRNKGRGLTIQTGAIRDESECKD